METTRKCPYCAEQIAPDAVRCRYCRSRLSLIDPAAWYRDQPGRKVAGVATALARALALPVGAVRAAFILGTFFNFLGPVVYLALWLTIPYRLDDESLLDRLLVEVKGVVARLWAAGLHGAHDGAGRHRPMS